MLRKIVLISLAVCGLFAGCARKKDPQAQTREHEGRGARDIALPTPFVWTLEPEEMTFPPFPASGSIHGKEFAPNQVQFLGGALRFRQGKATLAEMEVEIPLGVLPTEPIEGKHLTMEHGKAGRSPILLASSEPGRPARDWSYAADYALRLEFDRAKGGKIPGRIYLCVVDEAKSYLAGDFSLEMSPVSGVAKGPPGPDDAPFVRGTIAVKKQEKGVLEVGYIGQPDQGEPVVGSADCSLVSGTGVSSDRFAPRTTSLDISGKDSGGYLCRRLPPGRYFFYAGWNGRAAAWRWVDVLDGAQVAVDFTIDPARTGTLQVKVPSALAGETMRVIPLDDGRFPSLPFPPSLLTRHLKTEAKVQAGESSLDRLQEGAYRVLVGDARANVKIQAGATTRLDMARAE